ncbi:MAG: endolytic transglycosylase MltG [Bacteroidota bacterium]|nr:endolytic transglycosylase MltG [Bacteroidota bacterium]
MAKKKTKRSTKKLIIIICSIIVVIAAAVGFLYWFVLYKPNLKLAKDKQFIYIKSGSTYNMVLDDLSPILQDSWSFKWIAEAMKYDKLIKPGRYTLADGMGNKELIQLLRSGKQEPVKIIIQSHNRVGDIIKNIVANLETDSQDLANELYKGNKLKLYNILPKNMFEIFIPNTYFINWDTKPDSVIGRLVHEYDRFWNSERESKLKALGVTRSDAITIASLVIKETNKQSDMPIIAGVVFNRLHKKMNLEMDPTIKFALNDFTLKRIYNKHKDASASSPYNTYTHRGLPPGPICNPTIEAIDAVLNADNNDFIFYCASETRLGYHNFAETLSQHNANARRYQRWLDANRIR